MISTSSKYAIKAVLYLAIHSSESNKIVAKDLAEPVRAPLPYVSKLLQELSRQQLISSHKGPKGGFYLTKINKENTLMDVVKAIDGEERIHACLLDLEKCNTDRPCPLHHVVYPVKSNLTTYLSEETIDSFTEKYESVNRYFSLD